MRIMEINGTIFKILPQSEVSFGDGTKKMKGGFVIMSDGEYAKKVAFELFGDERLALLSRLSVGMPVKVNILPVSFEGKDGKYYSTLRCTNVFPLVAAAAPSANAETAPAPTASGDCTWNPTGEAQPFDSLPPDEALPLENDLPFA